MVEQSMVGYGIWRGHPTKVHLQLQGVHLLHATPFLWHKKMESCRKRSGEQLEKAAG